MSKNIDRLSRIVEKFSISILIFLFLLSFVSKISTLTYDDQDYIHYLDRVQGLLLGGVGYLHDLPVASIVYAPFYLTISDSFMAFKIMISLFLSLAVFLVYGICRVFKASKNYALLGAAVVAFNPYVYLLTRFGVWKNILGNFWLLLILLGIGLYLESGKKIFLPVLFILSSLLFFTHSFVFSIYFLCLLIYLSWTIVKSRNSLKIVLYFSVIAVGIAAMFLASVYLVEDASSSLWQYFQFTQFYPLQFNFPRFYETFSSTLVASSLLLFVLSVKKLDTFVKALALLGALLHVATWVVVPSGADLRLLIETYLPYSICLPVLLSQTNKEEKIFGLFISAGVILLYFARFIPGTWV